MVLIFKYKVYRLGSIFELLHDELGWLHYVDNLLCFIDVFTHTNTYYEYINTEIRYTYLYIIMYIYITNI